MLMLEVQRMGYGNGDEIEEFEVERKEYGFT